MKRIAKMIPIVLTLAGCMSAAEHRRSLGETTDGLLTIGLVQQRVLVGTSQADVATALGAPNIVTRDSQNREAWIYDKIATEASFSTDDGSISGGVSGSGTLSPGGDNATISGNLTGAYARQAGAARVAQRTLTVVIKFDRASAVDSVSYQSTSF